MIPIGDTPVRGKGPAFINLALIAVNTVIFIYESLLSQPALEALFNQYAVIPTHILSGQQSYTLITAMFLHGGWMHLIGNMLFLWVFGDNIEDVFGHFGYLVFYMIAGIVANFAHVFMNPASTLPSLGASGAIAGVMGAYILMFPRAQVRVLYFLGIFFGITRLSAILFLGIWAATQFLNGLASLGVPTSQTSGVAVWAHVGGFLFGMLLGLIFKRRAANVMYG